MTETFTRTKREPLEVLALLAGSTAYKVPTEGRSTAEPSLTSLDVAQAIASSKDKLGAAVAVAVACNRPQEWPKVHELAYPSLLVDLQRQNARPGIVAGAKVFRARIALHDAFHNLLEPQSQPSFEDAALDVGMRREDYEFLHRYATGFLQRRANTAAGHACYYLFANDLPSDDIEGPSLVLADPYGGRHVFTAETSGALAARVGAAIAKRVDSRRALLELFEDILANATRSRTLGVLSLNGRPHVAVHVAQVRDAVAAHS